MKSSILSISIAATVLTFSACSRPTELPKDLSALEGVQYPHSAEFKTSTQHGQAYSKSAHICAKCHGTDFRGGQSQVSCQKCHGDSFPHPTSFANPSLHGLTWRGSKADGQKQCQSCHKNLNEKGDSKAPSCQECHAVYPGYMGEAHAGMDHKEVAKAAEGRCFACHRGFFAKPYSDVATCNDCHDSDVSTLEDLTNFLKKIGGPDSPQASGWVHPANRALSGKNIAKKPAKKPAKK